jgi:hypothetical protein
VISTPRANDRDFEREKPFFPLPSPPQAVYFGQGNMLSVGVAPHKVLMRSHENLTPRLRPRGHFLPGLAASIRSPRSKLPSIRRSTQIRRLGDCQNALYALSWAQLIALPRRVGVEHIPSRVIKMIGHMPPAARLDKKFSRKFSAPIAVDKTRAETAFQRLLKHPFRHLTWNRRPGRLGARGEKKGVSRNGLATRAPQFPGAKVSCLLYAQRIRHKH